MVALIQAIAQNPPFPGSADHLDLWDLSVTAVPGNHGGIALTSVGCAIADVGIDCPFYHSINWE